MEIVFEGIKKFKGFFFSIYIKDIYQTNHKTTFWKNISNIRKLIRTTRYN